MFSRLKSITNTIKQAVPVLEFSIVFLVFILPPILNNSPAAIPDKPYRIFDHLRMFFTVFAAAAYEEMLYRVYIPDRLSMLLNSCTMQICKKHLCAELFAIVCFALGHSYLGVGSVFFAAAAGIVFRLLYCKIRRSHTVRTAFYTVWLLHGCWNSIIYYYLWST